MPSKKMFKDQKYLFSLKSYGDLFNLKYSTRTRKQKLEMNKATQTIIFICQIVYYGTSSYLLQAFSVVIVKK